MAKTYRDYQCIRCGVRRDVKMYTFSEDGFLRQANMCHVCADETHVYELNIEYLKKQKNLKEQNGNTKITGS